MTPITKFGPVPPERRFPPPWSVEELELCFIVRDANGQALAAKLLSKDEARRIAANVAKLAQSVGRLSSSS